MDRSSQLLEHWSSVMHATSSGQPQSCASMSFTRSGSCVSKQGLKFPLIVLGLYNMYQCK